MFRNIEALLGTSRKQVRMSLELHESPAIAAHSGQAPHPLER